MSNRIREEFIQKKEPVRLNKYLSEAGVCSRREADRLIETGKVSVDGSLEKDINLAIAKRLRWYLEQSDVEVVMSR